MELFLATQARLGTVDRSARPINYLWAELGHDIVARGPARPGPPKFIGWARPGPGRVNLRWAKNGPAHGGLEWAGP
ncbi:hypothetical protein TorRG33x02_082310 [Trema orientale]|uniref:Uncharacterized protein n=1 Tax=Trema orientale TaxID=63057 RepID=A0A2P5FDX4_TREOI|nr:hypothetical protein TorRG33x02_082310 [Trema orientale]